MSFGFARRDLTCLAAGVVAALTGSSPAGAEDANLLPPAMGTTELYASDPRSGLALGGFDPVSYAVDGRPRAGLPRHELAWAGLGWRFASAANHEAFRRDPESFAPRIGGHDPASAAAGRAVPGDPLVFAILHGRVYLLRSEDARERFAADPGLAGRAEAAWLRIRTGLVRG